MKQAAATLVGDNSPGAQPAKSSLRLDLAAAAVTGQISGLIMAVVVMAVFTIFLGKGPLYPVQVIGSFIFGDRGIQGFHLPAFLAGLVLHQLGPALFWSIVFGAAAHAFDVRRGARLVALGAAIGLLSQVVDVNLVLPLAMNALHGHDIWAEQVPAFWSWAAHLTFGLGLAIFPWAHDRVAQRFA
ncbi:MAG TPA: hypothetical protein VKE22_13970 [Haliangiales bacterium]|nr:hypothetical protein [Haliangiales bacterium]